jgi:GNAT superfamily N-acetyltransferase
MTDAVIEVNDRADPFQTEEIRSGLRQFNREATGLPDGRPLTVVASDRETGRIHGGIVGYSVHGCLYIDAFHLSKDRRGSGLGSQILSAAEAEGRQRGCRTAVLTTASFQAPGFYERQGWARFGEVDCDPPGATVIYFTKRL